MNRSYAETVPRRCACESTQGHRLGPNPRHTRLPRPLGDTMIATIATDMGAQLDARGPAAPRPEAKAFPALRRADRRVTSRCSRRARSARPADALPRSRAPTGLRVGGTNRFCRGSLAGSNARNLIALHGADDSFLNPGLDSYPQTVGSGVVHPVPRGGVASAGASMRIVFRAVRRVMSSCNASRPALSRD